MTSFLPHLDRSDLDWTKPSLWSLILANTVPLIGVLFFGWSTLAVVAVYWAENVIIGLINILKMITSSPSGAGSSGPISEVPRAQAREESILPSQAEQFDGGAAVHHMIKFFFVPFFTVHYGLFCLVHGVFVFSLLGDNLDIPANPLEAGPQFFRRLEEGGLFWAVAALAASHLFSYFYNFLWQGEFRRLSAPALMFQPYGRIIVLHIAILGGAFLILALGSPVWMLVVLVAGKTALDLALHLAEHAHAQSENASVASSALRQIAP